MRGSVLLSMLGFLVLLLFFAAERYRNMTQILLLHRIQEEALFDESALSHVLKAYTNLSLPVLAPTCLGASSLCFIGNKFQGDISPYQRIDGRVWGEFFPRFNLRELSEKKLSCFFNEREPAPVTGAGNALSQSALQSNKTCQNLFLKNSGYIAGNWEERGTLSFSTSSIIIVGGYADLERLALEEDIMLIALGDLILQSIKNQNSSSIRVTLISTTGRVSLGALEGADVALKLIGAKGVITTVPEGITQSPSLLPPPLKRLALGAVHRR